jgi:hypothetical protein
VAGTDGLAVVWMEISPGDPVFVYVADPKRNRVLARSVDWDGALGHLEAVGLIVRSSVQALLAGQTIGFEAQPVPIRKDVPRPVQPAEVGNFHVGLMVGYTPELLGGEAPVTHGLDVAAAVGYGDYAFARLGYRFMAPFLRNWSTNSVALVWRNPFTLGVGAQLPLGRVRLGAEIAGTLDIVSLDTRDVGPWVATAPSQDQLIFSLTPSVFASVRVVDPLSLFLSVSADIPLTDRHYLVHLSMGRDQTILTPYEVQPRGVIGLRFDIF